MTTPALSVIAEALAGHVTRTGQSAADVAAELGVSAETVRAWLSGRRPGEPDNEFGHLDTATKLGEWLRARIVESGCTVREIADSTDNVSMGTVYNWLRGEHLPPPPSGQEPDRFDLLLSNPLLRLNLRQRLQLDEIRRRLTGTSTRIAAPGPGWQARGLPGGTPSFTGRAPELSRLNRLLREYSRSRTAIVATVTGIGGVGKTALAVHWARSRPVRATFTDGCLYLNLNGYADTPPLSPESALAKLLLQLDVQPQDIPADPDARATRYQETLADRKLLILLDNAHAEPQLRPLLPSDPGCLAVITSRNRLQGLTVTNPGLTTLSLDTLSTVEAASLLRNVLRQPAGDAEIDALTAACGRLPLAIHIAAANYLTHHQPLGTSIAEYAATLNDDRLGQLVVGPSDPATTVTATLDRSYRHLDSTAQRLYRLLGLHPGTAFTTAAAASLAGLTVEGIRPALTELTQANLLSEPAADHHSVHDLLRDHAASLIRRTDPADGGDTAAQRRMTLHYLHTAHGGSLLLVPQRQPLDLPELDPAVTTTTFASPAETLAWFDAHLPAMVELVERCARQGLDAWCWQLAWALNPYLGRQAQGHTWVRMQRLALAAARRRSDPRWLAESHRMLGRALLSLGQYDQAHARLRDAIAGFEELDDLRGQATTLKYLGFLEHQLERYPEAAESNTRALDLYRRLGDRYGEADTLNNLGWCLARTGRYDLAWSHCVEALDRFVDLGQPDETANVLDSLGYIAAARGNRASAIHYYGRALAVYENADGLHYETARGHRRLADQLREAGDDELARDHYLRALALLERLNHREADLVRDRVAEIADDPARAVLRPTCRRIGR